MKFFRAAVRLFAFCILFVPPLLAEAHAADSAASAKCIDAPDGLGGDELVALCTSVMETEKDLPPARLARVLQGRGLGYLRKKDFDNATADFAKALETLPAGSDEHLRQILMGQREISIDRKKDAADAEAEKANRWLLLLVYAAGVCGIWALSFRTRIGALAYGTAGRISRSDYWLALVAVSAVAAVQGLAMVAAKKLGVPVLGPIAGRIFFVAWVATILLAATAVSIKRLHDRNRSAWIVVVPIAAVFAVLLAAGMLAVEPGDGGPFDRSQRAYNGVFAGVFGGLTPAGPVLIVAFFRELLKGGMGGSNLVFALGYLLALATSLWYLVEVGLRRGTVGGNTYGPEPQGTAPLRFTPQITRYAAVAVALIALVGGLYAFKPWRMLSRGPDQANIEAFALEHCRHALDEMTKDLGMGPNRQSAADVAIRACTILIGQNASDYTREQSYYTRGKAYEIIGQKDKAIADFKDAVKLKTTSGGACALFNLGVAGYQCSSTAGGTATSGPPEFLRCASAGDELGREWKPRPGPAEKVVEACTVFIDHGGEPEFLADAYFIRAKGYVGLAQDHKAEAIADLKKAHQLLRIPMYACGLARLGVSGYSCEGMTPCGLAHLGVPGFSCEGGAGGGGDGPLSNIH